MTDFEKKQYIKPEVKKIENKKGEITEKKKEEEKNERAMDMVAHVESEILPLPEVERHCDQIESLEKMKIEVDPDCELYVEREGKGEPLVLLHGGPGATHHYFHPHFSKFKDNAQMIYYDQRGCGLSDYDKNGNYSLDQAVDDLEKLRKKLGYEKWSVLGHSFGGLLAQAYALKYPDKVKGLVLVAAKPGIHGLKPSRENEFISKEEKKRMDEIRDNKKLSIQEMLYNVNLNGDWKRQNYYKPTKQKMAQIATIEWDHDEKFRDKVAVEADNLDLEGFFQECPVPTLIMEGEHDLTWNTDKSIKMQENHPNARFIKFDKSAHNPFSEEPKIFFNELKDFMAKEKDVSVKKMDEWKQNIEEVKKERLNSPDAIIDNIKNKWLESQKDEKPKSYFEDKNHYFNDILKQYKIEWINKMKNPGNVNSLGQALFVNEKYDEALACFRKSEELSHDNIPKALALLWQAQMLDLQKNRKQALEIYKQIIEMKIPNIGINVNDLGYEFKFDDRVKEKIKKPFEKKEIVK